MAEPWFDELAEFLRIPSVSADPAHAARRRARGRVGRATSSAAPGGECEVVDWHGQPLAIGEIRASHGGDARRPCSATATSTCSRRRRSSSGTAPRSSPRSATGTSTAAAPSTTRASSTCCSRGARELARAGELPVNVRFCCDGEEETGGHSIVEFLEADERGADAAVIFDSDMIRARTCPRSTLATRGIVYFHVTLRTGERDLHSGIFGGAALNAAHALIAMLDLAGRRTRRPARRAAAARDRPADRGGARRLARAAAGRRRARRPGRAAGRPARRRGVLPPHVRRAGARRERHRRAARRTSRRRCCPSRRSRTSRSGSPRARRSRRSRPRSSGCCARPRPPAPSSRSSSWSSSPPGLVPPDAKAIQLGLDAFERVLGARPALIRSGGTLPIVPALADKGIPTIITGFGLPDSNIHSPNERLRRRVRAARDRRRSRAVPRASRRSASSETRSASAGSWSPTCAAGGRLDSSGDGGARQRAMRTR